MKQKTQLPDRIVLLGVLFQPFFFFPLCCCFVSFVDEECSPTTCAEFPAEGSQAVG